MFLWFCVVCLCFVSKIIFRMYQQGNLEEKTSTITFDFRHFSVLKVDFFLNLFLKCATLEIRFIKTFQHRFVSRLHSPTDHHLLQVLKKEKKLSSMCPLLRSGILGHTRREPLALSVERFEPRLCGAAALLTVPSASGRAGRWCCPAAASASCSFWPAASPAAAPCDPG